MADEYGGTLGVIDHWGGAVPTLDAWGGVVPTLDVWGGVPEHEAGGSAPTVLTLPVITGIFGHGNTATVTPATWTGDPDTVTRQWQRYDLDAPGGASWVDITDEEALTYLMDEPADFPGGLRVVEIATNAFGSSAPAISATFSSPVAGVIAVEPDMHALFHDLGQGVAVGNPVASWKTHNQDTSLDNATGSEQPTRLATGVDFDGLSHHLRGGASMGVLVEGACTIVIGFDDISDTGTTGARTMISAARSTSGGTKRQLSVNYSRPDAPNGTRQRVYMHDGTSSQTVDLQGLSGVGADGYDLAIRCEGRGVPNVTRADRVVDPLVQIGADATRPSNLVEYEYFALGALAVGVGPTILAKWQGRVRYLLIIPRHLSDAELDTLRDELAAAGYLAP